MRRAFHIIGSILLGITLGGTAWAQAPGSSAACSQPLPDPITKIAIPPTPLFYVTATRDGCWVFVALRRSNNNSPTGRVMVFQRTATAVREIRSVPVGNEKEAIGWVELTHDQKTLIVGGNQNSRLAFLDVAKLISGEGDPVLGYIRDDRFGGSGGMAITRDDKHLFVNQRLTGWVSVIDLERARNKGLDESAIVGGFAVGDSPVPMFLPADEKHLYVTTGADTGLSGVSPLVCRNPQQPADPPDHREGALVVVDLLKARANPSATSPPVIASVPAGCDPVAVTLSPDGEILYVVSRGDNALLAFDARPVRNGWPPSLIARIAVGLSPTDVVVIDGGKKVVVANANQYAAAPNERAELTVIDTSTIRKGTPTVLGTIAVGGDPRHMFVSADGRTLFVTSVKTRTLEIIDLERLPFGQTAAPGAAARPAPANPRAADRAAYNAAARLTDPQKRVEALEKFIEDSPLSGHAHREIAKTLIKDMPDQTTRILVHAAQVRAGDDDAIATSLIDAGILLDKAEEFAAKELARARKQNSQETRQLHATTEAFMGAVYLKQGRFEEAKKAFRAAYDAIGGDRAPDALVQAATLDLARMAENEGDYRQALEFLSTAAVSSTLNASDRRRLETAYRKTHGDSLDGLMEALDARHEELFPSPIQPQPYRASSKSNRAVLAEVFPNAGESIETSIVAALERYDRKDLNVLVYHARISDRVFASGWYDVGSDPLSNPSTLARARSYDVKLVGVEAGRLFLNGIYIPKFVDDPNRVYEGMSRLIEREMEKAAGAEIDLNASTEGSAIHVAARVKGLTPEGYKLQIALVEERLRYRSDNGIWIHPMVVRSLAGNNAEGLALNDSGKAEWTFDLAAISQEIRVYLSDVEREHMENDAAIGLLHVIDPGNLAIVAFVQGENGPQILQSAYLKIKPSSRVSNLRAR